MKNFTLTMIPMMPNLKPGDYLKGLDEWYVVIDVVQDEVIVRHARWYERLWLWIEWQWRWYFA